MKKIVLSSLTLLVTLLFLTACGVPQKDYDKLASDLTAAQAQIQSLRDEKQALQGKLDKVSSDLTTAQTQIKSLQSDLSTKESELSTAKTQAQSLQSSLSSKESELQATKTKLAQAKSRLAIVNAIFIPSLTGEIYNWTDAQAALWVLGWMSKVNAVGDPTLTAKFDALLSGFTDKSMTDFFVYLLDSITKALE